jgi:flagellar biosynthetic protein FliR
VFGSLPAEVYGIGLVFCRVAALVMLIPGIGETSVPPRIRLALALILSMAFAPLLAKGFPPVPRTVGGMGAQIGIEVLIGLGLGSLLRMFLGALAVLGETVSLQTTLSFAQTANPLEAQPTATLGTFLTLVGLALVFATDLHQMFIAAIVRSYTLFPAGKGVSVTDFGMLAITTMGGIFSLGVQLAAPVIVFSLVFNVAAAFIGRTMPQFQIFFVATPLTVLLGLSIFAMSLGMVGLIWIERFRAFVERLT